MSSTEASESMESKDQLLKDPEEELQHSPDAEAAGEEEKAREERVVDDLAESQRDGEGRDVDEGEVNERSEVEETGRAIGNEEVSMEVLRCERSDSLGSSQVIGKEGSVNIEGTDEEGNSSTGKEVQLAGVYQSRETAEHGEHVKDGEYIVCEYQLYYYYKDSDARLSEADFDIELACLTRKERNKMLLPGNGGEINYTKGRCKWFNVVKGYGFITPEFGGIDVFVHQSTIKMDGFRSLEMGEEVQFKYRETMQGFETTDVRGPDGRDLIGSNVRPRSTRQKIRCYNCGAFQRHLAKTCPEPTSEKRCYRCKGLDHIAAQCTMSKDNKPGVDCNGTSVDPVNPSNVDVIQSTVDVIQSTVDVIQSTVDVIQSSDAAHTIENETLSMNHTQSSGGDVLLSREPGETIEEGIQSTEHVAV